MRVGIRKASAVLAVSLLAITLVGCDAISGMGSDNTPKPSPLVMFKPQFKPKMAWSTRTGSGVDQDYLLLGPAVADGYVFTADAKGGVFATELRNGHRVWKVATKTTLTSGPAAGSGIVVVGTANGQLLAFNEHTGAKRWQVALPNQALAAPQIGANRVLVKTIDGKLCALSVATGQILWIYDHSAPTLVLRASSAPQIVGNSVITGFSDGKLAAFNLANGQLLWQQTIAEPQGASQVEQMVDIAADPKFSSGTAYAATYQGKIAAVNVRTGQTSWQQSISTYTGLVLTPQLVVVTDAKGTVWAFNRSNGNLVWHQTQLLHRILTAPVLMGNYIVVGDGEGYLHWINSQTGQFAARLRIEKDKAIISPPVVVADNAVIVSTRKGMLAAVTLA